MLEQLMKFHRDLQSSLQNKPKSIAHTVHATRTYL